MLFCVVFVLLKLMVLQYTLFTKAHNMLRFLIETLRELSVIRLMTTRFQTIFANALSVVAGGNIIPQVELKWKKKFEKELMESFCLKCMF